MPGTDLADELNRPVTEEDLAEMAADYAPSRFMLFLMEPSGMDALLIGWGVQQVGEINAYLPESQVRSRPMQLHFDSLSGLTRYVGRHRQIRVVWLEPPVTD